MKATAKRRKLTLLRRPYVKESLPGCYSVLRFAPEPSGFACSPQHWSASASKFDNLHESERANSGV